MFTPENELKYCGNIDQANDYIRHLVKEDCNRIGITDWKIINEIIRTNNHQYRAISHDEFDDVGNLIERHGYSVCLRKKREAH